MCRFMQWSYEEYQATPSPVIDEVIALMREAQEEAERSKHRRR